MDDDAILAANAERNKIIQRAGALKEEAYRRHGLGIDIIAKTIKKSLKARTARQQVLPGDVSENDIRKRGWSIVGKSVRTGYGECGEYEYVNSTLLEKYEPDHGLRLKTAQHLAKDLGISEPDDRGGRGAVTIHVHTHVPEPNLPPPAIMIDGDHGDNDQ